MADDHETLIGVAARWERMYGELFVKAQRLTDVVVERDTQIAALRGSVESWQMAADQHVRLAIAQKELKEAARAEVAALKAENEQLREAGNRLCRLLGARRLGQTAEELGWDDDAIQEWNVAAVGIPRRPPLDSAAWLLVEEGPAATPRKGGNDT